MAKCGRSAEHCNVEDVEKKAKREHKVARSKEKVEEMDLPSPPPDPWITAGCVEGAQTSSNAERTRDEEDIMAYLAGIRTPPCDSRNSDCLSRNSATSTMAVTGLYTEEAFEQLDRLYEMAEQILALRDRNARLFKRVRHLEKLKVLRAADLRAERAVLANDSLSSDLPEEEDAGFAESLLDAILSSGRDFQLQRRNRSPSSRRRSRSLAASEKSSPRSTLIARNAGNGTPNVATVAAAATAGAAAAPKVSKWTRVKAAFKWERACPNDAVETTEQQQTPTTPTTPTTKYLRIPDVTSTSWSSCTLSPPSTSEMSGPSTPVGRASSASSSNEDVFDRQRKNAIDQANRRCIKILEPADKRRESEGGAEKEALDKVTNEEESVQRVNEPSHGKPLIRITTESNSNLQALECSDSPSSNCSETKNGAPSSKRPTPTLTITIPSNEEEFRSTSSAESMSPFTFSSALDSGENSPHRGRTRQDVSPGAATEFKRQRSTVEDSSTPKFQRLDSRWNKVRRAFLTNTAFSVPPSPVRAVARQSFLQDDPETPRIRSCGGSVEDLSKNILNSRMETRRDYQALREKFGAEFHRKLIEWERLKNNSTRGATTPSSPHDGAALLNEDRLAPEFKKKLQEWKRAKKGRRGSASMEQNRVNRRRLTDWQLWRSPSKPEARCQEMMAPRLSCGSVGSTGSAGSDGKSNACEDFVKKMEAWRRLSEASRRLSTARSTVDCEALDESEFLALDRILSLFGNVDQQSKQNGGSLQTDSSFMEKMASINCGHEVLIRTSVGSYRFEGISEEFTRKLYDWEKYRGISPRSSTFRLLSPAYASYPSATADPASTEVAASGDDEETLLGGMKRSKSASSLANGGERAQQFLRRSASLQSLNHLSEKLKEIDLMAGSPAPENEHQRREDTAEDAIVDDSEPEAMIVDIEDVIEETASPLRRVQPHQTPVYSVAASETTSIAVPLGTVTSSHEPSPAILMEVEDNSNGERWQSRGWSRRENWSSGWNGRMDFCERSSNSPEYKRTNFGEWNRKTDRSDTWKSGGWTRRSEYSNREEPEEFLDLDSYGSTRKNFGDETREECDTKSDFFYMARVSDAEDSSQEANEDSTVEDEAAEDVFVETSSTLGDESSETIEEEKERTDLPCDNKEEHQQRDVSEDQRRIDRNSESDEADETSKRMQKGRRPHHCYSYHSRLAEDKPAVDNFQLLSKTFELCSHFASGFSRGSGERRANSQYRSTTTTMCCGNYNCTASAGASARETTLNDEQKRDGNFAERSRRKCDEVAEEGATSSANGAQCDGTSERNDEYVGRRSLDRVSASSSSGGNLEFREATVKTTPLTVSSCRDARCVERIVLNKETLKRIVVPTASNDSSAASFGKTEEISVGPAANFKEITRTKEDAMKQCVVTTSRIKSNGRTKQGNVFVKTKRMIFSPFRRLEADRNSGSNDCAGESASASKSKNKCRSVSPRISKQDVLQRVPLSLPWPIRSSPKGPDVKGEEHEETCRNREDDVEKEEKLSEQWRYVKEMQEKNMEAVEFRERGSEREAKKTNDEAKRSAETSESSDLNYYEEIMAPVALPSKEERRLSETSSEGKDTEKRKKFERPSTAETLPSDLIHKLNILSNAAAKRDGRTNSCIETCTGESRSAKLRRAKEGFLSCRGGPLCQPSLQTSSSSALSESNLRSSMNFASAKEENASTCSYDWQTMGDGSCSTPSTPAPSTPTFYKNLNASVKSDLVKSASAGMINVDADTFSRLTPSNRGCESLPRSASRKRDSSGPLAKIVNKLKLSRLIRGKDNDERAMKTISTLCRQSLLIDVRSEFEETREIEGEEEEEEEVKE